MRPHAADALPLVPDHVHCSGNKLHMFFHRPYFLTTSAPEGFTPLMTRPLFVIWHCVTLTDNCAAVRRCTQIKLTSFFSHKQSFLLVVFDHLCDFLIARYKQKNSNNFEKKTKFFTFCDIIFPPKKILITFFYRFWPICFLLHIFVKKSQKAYFDWFAQKLSRLQTRRKIYVIFNFFLFFTTNGGDLRFLAGLRHCGGQIGHIKAFPLVVFDHLWNFYFLRYKQRKSDNFERKKNNIFHFLL